MEKDLPKPRKSEFAYHICLMFVAMELRLFRKLPNGLIKSLEVEEVASLLATLIVEVKPNSSHK